MVKRILVLAGTYQQADLWRNGAGIPPTRMIYSSSADRLRGYGPDTPCVIVGTFHERRDVDAIMAVVQSRGYPLLARDDVDTVRMLLGLTKGQIS